MVGAQCGSPARWDLRGGPPVRRSLPRQNVWGPGYTSELHYLKVYAYRIRRKLHDEQGQFLQSDPSVGYRLAPPD
jgi:two-component system KDP operon response regulator KdpE